MITLLELQNKASSVYPAVLLDKYSSAKSRRLTRVALLWILIVIFVFMVISSDASKETLVLPDVYANWLFAHTTLFRGLFFVFFTLWVMWYLNEAFYLSYYFEEDDVDFDVARLAFLSDPDDLTKSFLESEIGSYALLRLGIGSKQITHFLDGKRDKVNQTNFEIPVDYYSAFVSLADYGRALFTVDKDFAHFLAQYNITVALFVGALAWVDDEDWRARNADRWWIRSNLARVQSVGRNWAFGKTYLLEKYGNPIFVEGAYRTLGEKWRLHKENVEQIESVLVKDSGANVMLIAPTSESGLEIVAALGRMIFSGQILADLEDKRIFVINANLLVTETTDRAQFENIFIQILKQANGAGNVILVFPQLNTFLESAHTLGVDVAALLTDVLESRSIQIIGITDQKNFHEVVETNFNLMQHFEKVTIQDVTKDAGVHILQEECLYIERKHDVFITYQSLLAIAEGAERYFMATTYSDKILDLLQEVAAKARAEKKTLITADDVHRLVSIKTGVVQGSISFDEKKKLATLEEVLHKRVVGQHEAIQVISDAMRRGRLGINNPKRPIGSFLFLGPTGVGKTETTKALAESFFGSEQTIIRFDMSEYSGIDAVEKLIGSFSGSKTGVLAEKIINQPYGVLLLDEFEKTTKEVLDLFLQILDEGQFTDARGQTIIARNLIIVATSNAGSELIYSAHLDKKNLHTFKDEVVDTLIKDRVFKPELLNRFDGIILFHPLAPEHLREVAKLMLRKLDERLTQKGIRLDINDVLLDYLVTIGNNPKFGARAMNRAIQSEIEKKIADTMIAGDVVGGTRISFIQTANGSIDVVTSAAVL